MFSYDYSFVNLSPEKFYTDGSVAMYTNLANWRHLVTYLHVGGRNLIQTSLLCLSVIETEPVWDAEQPSFGNHCSVRLQGKC